MIIKLPPAGTDVLADTRARSFFSRTWYDFFLSLKSQIESITGGGGGIPPGTITVSQSDVVLGRSSAGAGAVEELTFTDRAQQLADDTTFEEMRNTLGLTIGEDVQAFDQSLQDVSDLTLASGDLLFHDGTQIQRLPIGTEDQALVVASGLPAWGEAVPDGRWEPLTNGDHTTPELIFVDGDVVMAFVEA